jgi:hypothetical protein
LMESSEPGWYGKGDAGGCGVGRRRRAEGVVAIAVMF